MKAPETTGGKTATWIGSKLGKILGFAALAVVATMVVLILTGLGITAATENHQPLVEWHWKEIAVLCASIIGVSILMSS